MAHVKDAAQFITELTGGVDKLKLFKLCYFAHGWHLAWSGRPLFSEPLEAWQYGPVPRALWNACSGVDRADVVVHVPGGQSANLSNYEKAVIESVADQYASLHPLELSDRSHDSAWKAARGELTDDAKCEREISTAAIRAEFTNKLRNNVDVPSAPPGSDDARSAELEPAAAAELESAWWDVFGLLSTR